MNLVNFIKKVPHIHPYSNLRNMISFISSASIDVAAQAAAGSRCTGLTIYSDYIEVRVKKI